MAQENFNVSQPNDGLGDKLRAAFIKVQSNFTDLFNGKVDKEAGKGLSTENYTTTEKNKLANIEDFAEVNVQSDAAQQDITQPDFIKNFPAIPIVDDYLLNGGYTGTAQDLENSITLQQATAGANKNLVDGIFQAGNDAGSNQTGLNVNQIGEGAGKNNLGDSQNAFGPAAGKDNLADNQNAFGDNAGAENTGDNQNAFGQGAGQGNTFNDVNLFGKETQADENGQTVFRSADGFMARLSTLLLTASRKYILPNKSGTIAMLSDIGASNSKNLGPTGLNQGGILTINTDAAKFDLSAGFGYIVNGHSDPDNPTYTKVTWVAKIANVIPNLSTQKQTYVSLDINGNLFFTNVPLTATQRRNFIRIGVLIHLNNSAVTYIDNQPTINIEIGGQVQDILEALGFRSLSGNRIFPVSNNLKIKKELGRVFKSGANFDNLTTQPHSFILAAQEPITFRYRTQTGSEGADITDITPAIYDLNGTITPVAATATLATIQRVYIFQDGVIRIQPGQRVFTSLNSAITALNSDVFVTDLDIAENGLYLGAIVLTRNTIDLSNISQAIFAPSIGTTANGSVASPALGYTAEDVANKQNNLAVDGAGAKYPTVDAVNAVLGVKQNIPRLVSASTTALNNEILHVTADATITDVVGDVAGNFFTVRVLGGIATVGGVAYGVGTLITRNYDGTVWGSQVSAGSSVVIQNLVKFTHTGTTVITKIAELIVPSHVIKDDEVWELTAMFSRNATLFTNQASCFIRGVGFPSENSFANGFVSNCPIGTNILASVLVKRRLLFREGEVNRTSESGGFVTDNVVGIRRRSGSVDLTQEIVIEFGIQLTNANDTANFEFAILRKIS